MKSYHQGKTFAGIFAMLNFSVVLLAEQVNRIIESHVEFSGRRDHITLRVYSRNKGYICVKMMARHRVIVFLNLIYFFLLNVYGSSLTVHYHKNRSKSTVIRT